MGESIYLSTCGLEKRREVQTVAFALYALFCGVMEDELIRNGIRMRKVEQALEKWLDKIRNNITEEQFKQCFPELSKSHPQIFTGLLGSFMDNVTKSEKVLLHINNSHFH